MRLLQVKQYHSEIATVKEQKALERWRAKSDGYGYPVSTMFYFHLPKLLEKYGINQKRKRGWIAFDDNGAYYGSNKEEAIKRFNKYH